MTQDGGQSFEMLWDCPYCGSKKLLGVTHRHCPGCGAAQDPKNRYFPNPGEEVAVKDHIYFGADRTCPSCQAPNSAKALFCTSCGSALDGSKEVGRKVDPLSEKAPSLKDASSKNKQSRVAGNQDGQKKIRLYIGLSIILGITVFTIFYVFYGKQVALKVESQRWLRTIGIEAFQEFKESSACDALPQGSEVIRRYTEERKKQVKDGESCKDVCRTVRDDQGDGSFTQRQDCTKQCTPRYRDEKYIVNMCAYRIGRWHEVRQVEASGEGLNPKPAWPTFELKSGMGAQNYGQERPGKRRATYFVDVIDYQKNKFTCEINEELWTEFNPRRSVMMEFDMFGAPRCGTLKSQ